MQGRQSSFVVGIPLCALLVGCAAPEGEADWTLQLGPQTHANQTPFDDSPMVKLLLRRATGDEVIELGTPQPDGSLKLDDLPPASALADVEAFGLAVEEPGGAPDAIDTARLLAYGEVPADGLAAGARLDLQVLVSELDSIGDLGDLPGNQQRFMRGVAVVPPGRVLLFGGATDVGTGERDANDILTENGRSIPTGDVFELADLDAGAPWSFEKLESLPEGATSPAARLGLTATTILVDGAPMVLVAGGRENLWNLDLSYDDWYLYDPEARAVVDQGKLSIGRSEHLAIPLQDGRVLLVGGWTGLGGLDTDDADLVDPARGKVERVTLTLGSDGASSGASLGTAGVLICGGVAVPGTNATISAKCQIMNLQGAVRDVAPLPIPLARHAMTPIGEGKVLATGGYTADGPFDADAAIEAIDLAYLYDVETDAWTAMGQMKEGRSAHRGIPLSDGRALIVGGVPLDGVFRLADDPSGESCPEIFDPTTGAFNALLDQCGTWGAGANPANSSWPDVGAVFLKGFTLQQEEQDAVGFVGVGPS